MQVKFPWVRVQELMQAHLPCKLAGVAYHPAPCAHLATELSAEIRDLVRAVTPPHYRLGCSISTGGKGQVRSAWGSPAGACGTHMQTALPPPTT